MCTTSWRSWPCIPACRSRCTRGAVAVLHPKRSHPSDPNESLLLQSVRSVAVCRLRTAFSSYTTVLEQSVTTPATVWSRLKAISGRLPKWLAVSALIAVTLFLLFVAFKVYQFLRVFDDSL